MQRFDGLNYGFIWL